MSNLELFLKNIKDYKTEDSTNLEEFQSESLSSNSEPHSSSQDDKKEEINSSHDIHQEIEEESHLHHQSTRIVLSKIGDDDSIENSIKAKEGHNDDDDEDDGFRTPTSLDHRIPEATHQCPPAPRKIKPSLKRKPSFNNHCTNNTPRMLLDLSEEVQLSFPSQHDPHQRPNKVPRLRPN